mmetsp:Transcript_23391/g.64874  ORF Transcript_23391/g.64874 Transcript_23391/m.64874 type:complete len:785 (+) Transcript_23391:170-2524(+)
MIKRFASFGFFLVATTFDHIAVAWEPSKISYSGDSTGKRLSVRSSSNECEDCIQKVQAYFSKTVQDPKQFCIENEICSKTEAPSYQPTEAPSFSPSTKPSVSHSNAPSSEPSLRPSSLPSDGPSFLPSSVPTAKPSDMPSDGPSLLPSFVPTFVTSEVPTDWPSIASSTMPTMHLSDVPTDWPSLLPSFGQSDVPTDWPSLFSTGVPTGMLTNDLIPNPTDVSSDKPSTTSWSSDFSNEVQGDKDIRPGLSSRLDDTKSTSFPIRTNQPTVLKSLPTVTTGAEFIPAVTSSWSTTVSSIFLKNIDTPMDLEITQKFSSIVLQFLIDHSSSIYTEGTINFSDVEVVGQGPEFGNSTEIDTHIDGMHVYFQTITEIADNHDIDLPWVIEKIFKTNKNDFLFRLTESNEFFVPIDVGGRSSGESLPQDESRLASVSDFMNSWVIASLAVVLCSIFITTILMTRMVQGDHDRPRRFCGKSSMHPLSSLEETSTNDSDQMVKPEDKKRSDDITDDIERNDYLDNQMNLDEDSLAGLKLLSNEDSSSLAYSKQSFLRKKNHECKGNMPKVESESHQLGNMKGDEVSKQKGQYARLRKREIEHQIQKRVSNEGTSLEAILMATSSFNTDEDGDQDDGVSGVEVCTDDFETHLDSGSQTSSLLQRILHMFRSKKKKHVPRLEPVQMVEDGDSLLSYPITPARSVDKRIEYVDISVGSGMIGEGVDNYPKTRTSVFSPVVFSPKSLDAKRSKTDRPDRLKTTFISSPISKRLLKSNVVSPNSNTLANQNEYYI